VAPRLAFDDDGLAGVAVLSDADAEQRLDLRCLPDRLDRLSSEGKSGLHGFGLRSAMTFMRLGRRSETWNPVHPVR
jgi:hypothetical protein